MVARFGRRRRRRSASRRGHRARPRGRAGPLSWRYTLYSGRWTIAALTPWRIRRSDSSFFDGLWPWLRTLLFRAPLSLPRADRRRSSSRRRANHRPCLLGDERRCPRRLALHGARRPNARPWPRIGFERPAQSPTRSGVERGPWVFENTDTRRLRTNTRFTPVGEGGEAGGRRRKHISSCLDLEPRSFDRHEGGGIRPSSRAVITTS